MLPADERLPAETTISSRDVGEVVGLARAGRRRPRTRDARGARIIAVSSSARTPRRRGIARDSARHRRSRGPRRRPASTSTSRPRIGARTSTSSRHVRSGSSDAGLRVRRGPAVSATSQAPAELAHCRSTSASTSSGSSPRAIRRALRATRRASRTSSRSSGSAAGARSGARELRLDVHRRLAAARCGGRCGPRASGGSRRRARRRPTGGAARRRRVLVADRHAAAADLVVRACAWLSESAEHGHDDGRRLRSTSDSSTIGRMAAGHLRTSVR